MQIEILNIRDPDASSDVRVWIDGVEVSDDVVTEDVDPGAGYHLSEWRKETEEVRTGTRLSPSFAQAVASARDEAESSQYIRDDTDEED